jgi:hypothetical protein
MDARKGQVKYSVIHGGQFDETMDDGRTLFMFVATEHVNAMYRKTPAWKFEELLICKLSESFRITDSNEHQTDSCDRLSECYESLRDSTALGQGSDAAWAHIQCINSLHKAGKHTRQAQDLSQSISSLCYIPNLAKMMNQVGTVLPWVQAN